MALRKWMVGFLTVAMISPAWGAGEPIGSVTSTSDATVRDTKLTPGSTVFAGDVISVAAHGAARIVLSGGAQAEVLGNSSVRLTMADSKAQIVVDRGQASFRSAGSTGMSALVADATVRPADRAETSAVIQSLSDTHAVVAAQKGALLVTTAHDGKLYTVREGEALDLSATADPQQNSGAYPAGKAAPRLGSPSKAVLYWTVGVVGGGAIIAAYLLARGETKLSPTELGNSISPHTLN